MTDDCEGHMNIDLQRTDYGPACTEGKMQPGAMLLYTLELPWVPEDGYPGGHPDTSCVSIRHLCAGAPRHGKAPPKTFALVNRTPRRYS